MAGAILRNAVFVLLLSLFAAGCGKLSAPDPAREELLIYCGITMIQPIQEIADIVEDERNCVIKITKGGSGDLLRMIQSSQAGDLYLPGSETYMNTCLAEGLVARAECVGYNTAAIVVPEGNPKGIPMDPACFTNPAYVIILSDPDTGSIGREARAILKRRGVFDVVMEQDLLFTTDSKDITRAIREGTADMGINWYATAMWPQNADHVDALTMDKQYAPRNRLMLGLLRYSQFPGTAKRIMEIAISAEGRALFRKYGFQPQPDPGEANRR